MRRSMESRLHYLAVLFDDLRKLDSADLRAQVCGEGVHQPDCAGPEATDFMPANQARKGNRFVDSQLLPACEFGRRCFRDDFEHFALPNDLDLGSRWSAMS